VAGRGGADRAPVGFDEEIEPAFGVPQGKGAVLCFLPDECSYFIALDTLAGQIAHG
jgi:hypothetical protein